MKSTHLPLTPALLILVFSSLTYGQSPVYTASDYAGAGDNFVYTTVIRPSMNLYSWTIQSSGANKTWDFRYLYGLQQYQKEYYSPQTIGYGSAYLALCGLSCYSGCLNTCSLPFGCNFYCTGNCAVTCGSQWAGYNLAEQLLDDINLNPLVNLTLSDQFLIISKKNNGLEAGALAATVNGIIPMVIPYNGQDKLLQFPMQFGNAHQSSSSFSIDLAPLNVNLLFAQQQNRRVEVTGYGTIHTPYQTYNNALQVRTRLSLDMSLNYNGITMSSAQFPSILKPDDFIEYAWYVAGEGAPVFRAIGVEKAGISFFLRVDYLDNANWWSPFPMFNYFTNINFLKLEDARVGVQFINQSTGASSYLWNFGDGTSSADIDPLHVYDEGGWYEVTLTAYEGRQSESYTKRIFLATASAFTEEDLNGQINSPLEEENTIEAESGSGVKVYPNPFNDKLTVELISKETGQLTIELFDAYGRRIFLETDRRIESNENFRTELNFSNDIMSGGVYFLRVKNGSISEVVPVTKF